MPPISHAPASARNTPHGQIASVLTRDHVCIGWIFRRRPGEVESYTADEDPIGTYADEAAALEAVIAKAGEPAR